MNYSVVWMSLKHYRKLRHEFKSKIYWFVIVEGVDAFYEAYDKGDSDCLYEFLIPRAKHEWTYIDDGGEAFENSSYYDIIEHIKHSQIQCLCFKKLFINFSFPIEELVLIFHNSIQDYFDCKTTHNFIDPKNFNSCNANVCQYLYYSTAYDDDYDDGDDFYDFAEIIQNDRATFFSSYNNLCRIKGVFDKFYLR